MPSPTLISPNTGNYRVGKGKVEFKAEGSIDWHHLGNCSSMEFTPNVDKLDHFSAMEGVKSKDASIVLTRGGAIKLILDEWTPRNVSFLLLGTINEGATGGPTVQIFDSDEINGELRFTSSNTRGPKWNFHYYNVSITPNAAIDAISEEWGTLEVNAEVLVSQTVPHVGSFGEAQLTNIDS